MQVIGNDINELKWYLLFIYTLTLTGVESVKSVESFFNSAPVSQNDNQEAFKWNFLRGPRGLRGSIFNIVTNSVKSGAVAVDPFRIRDCL